MKLSALPSLLSCGLVLLLTVSCAVAQETQPASPSADTTDLPPITEQIPSDTFAPVKLLPGVEDMRHIKPGTRPYIYGCGIMWGYWYDLGPEKARQWDEMNYDLIKAMGGTNVPGNIVWADVEKERGKYDWTRLDRQIRSARERGLEVFCYTGFTPDWALPDEVERGKGLGYRFPPKEEYAADFERFFEAVARRYKGVVKYYNFWNEPNGCSWINPGCSNGHMAHTYAPWLIRWYRAMKKGDPDSVLCAAALDYNQGVRDGWKYIEDLYRHGAGDSFDAISIHPYGEPMHWQAIHDTYAVLVRHGHGHKKLWINEYGWNTTDEAKKSERLVEVLNEFKKPEYHMVFQANYLVLTNLDKSGHDYGLCNQDVPNMTITPRQSYETFKSFDKTFPPGADQPPTGVDMTGLPEPPPPPAGPNLLQNPNFEEDFVEAPGQFQEGGDVKYVQPPEWNIWGGNMWVRSGSTGHLNHTPFGAVSVATNWGQLDNAVYQRVQAKPGHTYKFSAYTRGDTDARGGEFISRRVGIDPTGGVDPLSPRVIWSAPLTEEEVWQQQTVEAKAAEAIITVFVHGKTLQSNGWQWCHFDTTELLDVTE